MPDTKITALTAIGANPIIPSTFPIPMVDLTDTSMAASGTTKKVTVNQILGAGGTATLASATISGDLTVDTSTLKVDSANNRVGIGTASPTVPLYVTGNNATATAIMQDETNGAKLRLLANSINFDISNGGGGGDIAVSGANPFTFRTNGSERYRIASDGVATWSNVGGVAGTAMTLNSTGLGVGGSPASKLSVFAGADGDVGFFRGGSTRQLQIGTSATAGYLNADNGSAGFELRVNGTARAYFDTSGNVGIGVTPAGTGGCLQLKSGITFPATQVASSDANTLDDYEEGTWTPTVSAETGTLTAYTVISANYTKIGRLVSTTFDIRIDTAGTGTAGLKVSLPFSPSLGGQTCGAGREYINTGKMCQVPRFDATNAVVYFYDNGTVIANTNRVMCSYTYFV